MSEITEVIFERPYYWTLGGIAGTELKGTLRIYKNGRLEYDLDVGQKVISCPVSLLKYQIDNRSLESYVVITVGKQGYMLLVNSRKLKNAVSRNIVESYINAKKDGSQNQELKTALDSVNALPADTDPILALDKSKYKTRNMHTRHIPILVFVVFVAVLVIIGQINEWGLLANLIIFAFLAPVLFWFLYFLHKSASNNIATENMQPNAASYLPAGSATILKPSTFIAIKAARLVLYATVLTLGLAFGIILLLY